MAMGRPGDVEHPEVVAAIEMVIARTRAVGRFIGSGMGPDPDYAFTMAKRGVQWLQVGSDYGYLIAAMDRITGAVRVRLSIEGASGGTASGRRE
jgi:2-keto-3-deoxy-L-rhamnonate aldolase RhmA